MPVAEKKLSINLKLIILATVFLFAYFVPFGNARVSQAVGEALLMLSEYAREHVLLCLVPAFFIAGAIMVFLNQQAVIRYLGPKAGKITAYSVASVSGAILAVCSCTVLPLFKGIYRKGAGLGPAVSFLYSGPAINILAIVLTAKVLGFKIGIARAVGAILFAFIIGFLMHLIFHKEDEKRLTDENLFRIEDQGMARTLAQNILYMLSMIGILVFINWSPSQGSIAVWDFLYKYKYIITAIFTLLLLFALVRWFRKEELKNWVAATRDFAVQILPLLFGGVLLAGFLLGRPGHQALIPEAWVASLVGGNSLFANFTASIAGALMYFATLTEVPIIAGTDRGRYGPGTRVGTSTGGPYPFPSLDPGHQQRARAKEDHDLRWAGNRNVNPGGKDFRPDRLI